MQQITTTKVILLILLFSLVQNSIGRPLFIRNLATNPSSSAGEVYDCVDAWIIICGDRPDHELSSQIWLTSQWVYHMVQACGCPEEDIYYLVAEYDIGYTTFEDNITTDANIEYAFQTWAPTKVGANGFLGVYMVDHGGTNSMIIAPYGTYTASELDQDLDAFEAASGCDRILVIYEACHSGSFLDEPSQSNRIIITSTSPEYGSALSPTPPNRAMFADNFFPSLVAGKSVGDAFVDANNAIIALGYGESQFPCIEDNHDAVGHQVNAWGELPSTGDGYDANNLYLCVDCPTLQIQPPYFFKIPLKKWVVFDPSVVIIPVSVEIRNTTNINTVYVRTVPEDWVPPDPVDENATRGWDPAEDTYRHYLFKDPASGNYTGVVELLSPTNNTNYNLCFIVEDEDGYRGPIVKTQIGLNDGEAPLDIVNPTVWIKNPFEGETVSENITIIAEGADDNSGLDQIQLLIDGVLLDNIVMPDYLPYPEASYTLDSTEFRNGEHNITAIATDNAGNSASFSVIITIRNPTSWVIWAIAGGAVAGIAIVVLLINSVRKKKHRPKLN